MFSESSLLQRVKVVKLRVCGARERGLSIGSANFLLLKLGNVRVSSFVKRVMITFSDAFVTLTQNNMWKELRTFWAHRNISRTVLLVQVTVTIDIYCVLRTWYPQSSHRERSQLVFLEKARLYLWECQLYSPKGAQRGLFYTSCTLKSKAVNQRLLAAVSVNGQRLSGSHGCLF